MEFSRAWACLDMPVNRRETWYPVCLLPEQAMTTPLHWMGLSSCGDCRATVISVHRLNGAGLRNSTPLL